MLAVFEAMIFALIVFVAITQIVLPTIAGCPVFPSVRLRRSRRIWDEVKGEVEEAEIDREIEKTRSKLRAIRNETQERE